MLYNKFFSIVQMRIIHRKIMIGKLKKETYTVLESYSGNILKSLDRHKRKFQASSTAHPQVLLA